MGAVIGVDPSIASTGVAAAYPTGEVVVRRVQSKPQGERLGQRVRRMRGQAAAVVAEVKALGMAVPGGVDLVVVEGPAFMSQNAQAHQLAGFWWLLAHGLERVAPLAVMQPTSLKKFATGKGSGGKEQVLLAVERAFPGAVSGDDEADALVLAVAGAVRLGRSVGGAFPSAGLGSLDAVQWPVEMEGAA